MVPGDGQQATSTQNGSSQQGRRGLRENMVGTSWKAEVDRAMRRRGSTGVVGASQREKELAIGSGLVDRIALWLARYDHRAAKVVLF